MFKKIVSAVLTAVFAFFASSAIAQQTMEPTKTKQWNKHAQSVKKTTKSRAMTSNGKNILVDEQGTRYLLTDDGSRYMVDQNGEKIRVDLDGKVIPLPSQKVITLRLGPGPVA